MVSSRVSPDQGPNPQPRHVPCRKIELTTLRFTGCYSDQMSHTSQSHHLTLLHQALFSDLASSLETWGFDFTQLGASDSSRQVSQLGLELVASG